MEVLLNITKYIWYNNVNINIINSLVYLEAHLRSRNTNDKNGFNE